MEKENTKFAALLEDEWYLVRNSGETPEIALHSALYYLTLSEDGPRIILNDDQIAWLRQAAVDRFCEIIIRDLQHTNYGTPCYRGISRSIVNYRRFCNFCERQKINRLLLRNVTAVALRAFLETEMEETKRRPSIIDCSWEALHSLASDVGIDLDARFLALFGPGAE